MRSELVADMQMSLLYQAKRLRAQENPDEFRASQLEARWEMRYRLDSLGYCWTEEVQEAYGTLSNQFHESAHDHLEKIIALFTKSAPSYANELWKSHLRLKKVNEVREQNCAMQACRLIQVLFHPCTKLTSMTTKINANGIG